MPQPAGSTVADHGTRVDGNGSGQATTADHEAAQRAFSTSMLVSGTRCLLTYVVLPILAPALGLATGVGPAFGVVIGSVAIVFNVLTIRRFHRSGHRWRWGYSGIAVSIIALLVVMMAQDLTKLL